MVSGAESIDWNNYEAVLFDLDGVLTPTAKVHLEAWAASFNEFLKSEGIAGDFTDEDYFKYVDGRPRYEGVQGFLESRGVHLPAGELTDSPEERTVAGLGNKKNTKFAAILEEQGVAPFPGSLALLDLLTAKPIALAVVSSSKNARAVLASAGLIDRFAFIIDGEVAARRNLAGKPAPDTFLAAANDLNVAVLKTVVIEDAILGVEAARAGDFGLVIGVDRGAGSQALLAAGADIVVNDLMELL